jgi:hypothetical protein
MSSVEIWHDVCIDCHPDRDLAICGTKIEGDHEEAEDGDDFEDGQNCVVCMSMECPECFEPEDDRGILGLVDDGFSSD